MAAQPKEKQRRDPSLLLEQRIDVLHGGLHRSRGHPRLGHKNIVVQ
jgi:hypothetical protein